MAPGIRSASGGYCTAGPDDHVIAAGEHERRGSDLGKAVRCFVIHEGVDKCLQVLGALFVRVGKHPLNDLLDRTVVVRPGSVDVQEEPLQRDARSVGATSTSHRMKRAQERR